MKTQKKLYAVKHLHPKTQMETFYAGRGSGLNRFVPFDRKYKTYAREGDALKVINKIDSVYHGFKDRHDETPTMCWDPSVDELCWHNAENLEVVEILSVEETK